MGIIYKMLRHKDISTEPIRIPKKRRLIAKDRQHDQEIDSDEQKQFSAEHILQLCRFLAEKSRKNKFHKINEESRQMDYHNLGYEVDKCDEISTAETLMLLQQQRLNGNHTYESTFTKNCNFEATAIEESYSSVILTQNVLVDKLLSSENASNFSSSNGVACQQQVAQHYRQKHEKRDILLKIRRQIFERKRKRQLALELADIPMEQRMEGVWRPW